MRNFILVIENDWILYLVNNIKSSLLHNLIKNLSQMLQV